LEVLITMEKILVIQTAFIGDAILTLPMIEKLKDKFPLSEIDVLCIPSTLEIFAASPFVSEVLVMDKKKTHTSLLKLYKFTIEIKKRNYSKIFSPHRSFRTSFIVMQSGVRDTYGFSTSSLFHVYRNVVEYRPNIHEVQRNLDLVGCEYSSESWKVIPQIKVNESSCHNVAKYISSINVLNDKLIAIAPGSIWETKKYPEKYFKEIIRSLVDQSYKILIIGGESDKELCERLSNGFDGKVFSTAGLFSISESIELLKSVKLLLTNDSAPTHFGMCADIPVLTIYTSTIPEFGFYPYNNKSSYISLNDLSCKPCGIHGFEKCPISTFECGNKLFPQIIISKMEKLISD
jgi:heptosyltransferase II